MLTSDVPRNWGVPLKFAKCWQLYKICQLCHNTTHSRFHLWLILVSAPVHIENFIVYALIQLCWVHDWVACPFGIMGMHIPRYTNSKPLGLVGKICFSLSYHSDPDPPTSLWDQTVIMMIMLILVQIEPGTSCMKTPSMSVYQFVKYTKNCIFCVC